MRTSLVMTALLITTTLPAQSKPAAPAPIHDNSFLVEEAYNQGRGIVQHIGTFARAPSGGAWTYTFTQEWPVTDQRHQLSYTLPLSRADRDDGGDAGLGDVALNYRYHVGRIDGARSAFAPRLTLLVPTGSSRRGLGTGGAGLQVNLPLSVELPASLVAHSNAGLTFTPRARDALGDRATTDAVALGQSVIWLVHPKLNLMLEGVWTHGQHVAGLHRTEWGTDAVLSPGIRGAIDYRSGLQVVPGLAVPIGVGPSRGERSVFAYLSFEHPFARQAP